MTCEGDEGILGKNTPMQFAQIHSSATIQIQSYQDGVITINQQPYTRSLIALPDKLITDFPVDDVAALTIENCAIITQLKPEILLIGTGSTLIFPDRRMMGYLQTQGFGVDVMNTAAACRTFQILTSEHRRCAALLLVPSLRQ